MKHIAVIVGLGFFMSLPSWVAAQDTHPDSHTLNHGELGVYADYLRFAPFKNSDNYVGVGGRVAFNMNTNVALEAEMNYDFARNYTSTSNNGATTTFVTTSVRPLSGFFGPKFQFGTSQPFRAFVDGKIGFIDFSTNNSGVVSGGTFAGAVSNVGNGGTHLAFFPGGGIEGFIGPIGLRLDVGDEIYLNNGTHNNLRATFGPTLRF